MRAVMFIHGAAPRIWTVEDIAFVTEASSRLWSAVSRAKAELERRMSEEFNRRMLASSANDELAAALAVSARASSVVVTTDHQIVLSA